MQGRSLLTLIAGLAVGTLIGAQIHGAVGAAQNPCSVVRQTATPGRVRHATATSVPTIALVPFPTVTPITTRHGVVYTLAGGGIDARKFDTTTFKVKGAFTVQYTVSPDPNLSQYTAGDFYLYIRNNSGDEDSIGAQILSTGEASKTGSTTESRFDCSQGCYFNIESEGMDWSLQVSH